MHRLIQDIGTVQGINGNTNHGFKGKMAGPPTFMLTGNKRERTVS